MHRNKGNCRQRSPGIRWTRLAAADPAAVHQTIYLDTLPGAQGVYDSDAYGIALLYDHLCSGDRQVIAGRTEAAKININTVGLCDETFRYIKCFTDGGCVCSWCPCEQATLPTSELARPAVPTFRNSLRFMLFLIIRLIW